MNDLTQNGVVKPMDGFDTPIYLINDNNAFSITEFKMMENLNCLLKCCRSLLNGMLQLVYLNNGFSPLNALYANLSEEQLILIIGNICDALLEIKSNGFMHCNNVDFSNEKIYVDPKSLSVKLVYLPVVGNSGSNNFSIAELNAFLQSLIDGFETINPQTANAIKLFGINNSNKTLEDVKQFYKSILNGGKNEVPTQQENKEKVLYLSSNDAGVETRFRINKSGYTIGKKRSAVDGLLANNPYVSRVHCKIIKKDDRYYVSDLGSANGTFVNNVEVKPGDMAELHNGDSIRLSRKLLSVLSVEIKEE